MENIFIKGSHGTGKTFLARAMAYFIGKKGVSARDVKKQNIVEELQNINEYINSEYVEFIQIHPSLSYEDIVYGIDIQVKGSLTLKYNEKRIKSICDRADRAEEKEGKKAKYFIILDDADRADMSSLLGNLIYAIEYRKEELVLTDGALLKVPENIVFIITESIADISNKTDYSLLRRFTYIEQLSSDKSILEKYYQDFSVEDTIIDVIIDVYNSVELFIKENICEDLRFRINEYIPGHGMYIVNCHGLSGYEVLQILKYKIKYQVIPYLKAYLNESIIQGNVEELWIRIQSKMNIGTNQSNQITKVEKVKLINNQALPFSLKDTENYLRDTIYANMPTKKDLRGIMECVIDAIWLNKIFSNDLVFFSLLTDINIIRFSNRQNPNRYAAYFVEIEKANDYWYRTSSGSKHSFFSIKPSKKGRWVEEDRDKIFTPTYQLTNGFGIKRNYAYLIGFREAGTKADSSTIDDNKNGASIFPAVYRLIKWYYKLYIQEINLKKIIDIELDDIYNLALLESKYWELILAKCTKKGELKKEGKDKLKFLVETILNLKLLWTNVDNEINVDEDKFKKLKTNINKMSISDYEGLFNITSGKCLPIQIERIEKMTDLNNYQDIMDRIGVKQMIFQGPPGTSKTFEARKFVLRQLDDTAYTSLGNNFSQQSIGEKLTNYKLEESDYIDPKKSPKLKTGGWDIVQFHPSYGYEDFVRGIEVKATGSTPTYENVNRLLGKIAEFAKIADEQAIDGEKPKFYLIIDEINRANLATVFGELIYGLEYRDNPVSTPYQIKTVSGAVTKDIVINNNLYIIGTMNTADKSIDGIDYAIRRRFLFIDSPADRKIIEDSINRVLNPSANISDSIELFLFDVIQLLFSREDYFNNEYQKSDVEMGHTYFLRKSNVEYIKEMEYRFIFQIIPILREYIKEGILDSIEDLKSKESSVEEISSQTDRDNRVLMASDNIMLYIKYFGTLNKDGRRIDNFYISEWITSVNEKLYP